MTQKYKSLTKEEIDAKLAEFYSDKYLDPGDIGDTLKMRILLDNQDQPWAIAELSTDESRTISQWAVNELDLSDLMAYGRLNDSSEQEFERVCQTARQNLIISEIRPDLDLTW